MSSSLSERIGGILVAPVSTLRELVRQPGGRGASDVALLIAARLIAGETPRLLRAIFRGIDLGAGAGVSGVINALLTIAPDVIAILVASMLLSVLAGRRAKGTQEADPLDVAAYAWVPYLTVQLASALLFTLRGHPPSTTHETIILGVALAWSFVVWSAGLWVLRDARKQVA